jgi:hypothetical protein
VIEEVKSSRTERLYMGDRPEDLKC